MVFILFRYKTEITLESKTIYKRTAKNSQFFEFDG